MERVGIDLNGGNDNVQFYSNLNVMHQSGLFKTDQTDYNSNSNDVWVNYRSNVDVKINKYMKAYVRLSGNIKRERTPGSANQTVYTSLFEMPSSIYGPVTPELTDADGNIILPGDQVVTTDQLTSPAYGMLNRTGYIRHTVTNITSQFGMDVDLGFLTKGLSVNGVFAYQTNSVGSLSTTQDYERYERTESRVTQRNGYRSRAWDTRLGTVDLKIPKLRQGSFFPSILEPRRRAEQALASVIQEAYVKGVSTR